MLRVAFSGTEEISVVLTAALGVWAFGFRVCRGLLVGRASSAGEISVVLAKASVVVVVTPCGIGTRPRTPLAVD